MQVEIRLLALPVSAVLGAAHDPTPDSERLLTVVRIESEDGQLGWGECSALNRVGYTSEDARSAYDLLRGDPRLAAAGSGDELRSEAPMAMAALEMAEFDMRLKAQNISLASYLGVRRTIVPAGAVIPLGSLVQTVEAVQLAADEGFSRVKLKVDPRSAVDPVELVARVVGGFPDIEVVVDANASFDADSAPQVEGMSAAGASAIEQPFPVHEVALAAALVERGLHVIADEAVISLDAVQDLVANRACTGVVVKSSRLGGLFPAFEMLGWCLENGVAAAAGGMQESGLGRAALAVVAAHDACTLTGDVSPARRWLAQDPWDDLQLQNGEILVPTGAGVAPPPDPTLLDRFTIASDQRIVGTS
ncbi:MAG: enolase C-terminal domain-like protein [Acidimicrobiales bacterium]